MIVQAKLAPGDTLGMLGDLFNNGPITRLVCVQRMGAGRAPQMLVLLGEFQAGPAVVGRCRDRDRAVYASGAGISKHTIHALGELLEREMTVRVDHGRSGGR